MPSQPDPSVVSPCSAGSVCMEFDNVACQRHHHPNGCDRTVHDTKWHSDAMQWDRTRDLELQAHIQEHATGAPVRLISPSSAQPGSQCGAPSLAHSSPDFAQLRAPGREAWVRGCWGEACGFK